MGRKLFDEETESPISPLIDVVMNGMAALFIILMVYLVVAQPARVVPLGFLTGVEPSPAIAGQSYAFTFPVAGGQARARSFAVQGKLPPGIEFDVKTGTLFGTPAAAAVGQHQLRITVTDGRETDARPAILPVFATAAPRDPVRDPLALLYEKRELPAGRVGVPYEAVLGGKGGVGPHVWRLRGGRLPDDLKLLAGRISGNPKEAGSFEIRVELADAPGSFLFRGVRHEWAGATQERTFSLRIHAPAAAAALELPVGRVGEPYLGTLHAGGLLPDERVVWTQEIPGLAPSPDGLSLVGIPREAKALPVSFAIQRGTTRLAAGSGTVRILPPRPAPRVDPVPVRARVGEAVRWAIPYRGLLEPVTARLAGGSLPAGLRLDAGGALTGSPEKPGKGRLQIELTDAAGAKHRTDVDLSVRGKPKTLRIEAPPRLDLVVGRTVSWPLAASGGEGEYEWTVGGTLPAGLAAANGRIEGEVRESGSWQVELGVRDLATGESASQRLALEGVHDDPSPLRWVTSALPPAVVGTPYNLAFAVAGGIGEPRFEISGALPAGLSFAGGKLSGTPARAGAAEIEVAARDAVGRTAEPRRFRLAVKAVDHSVPAVITRKLPPVVPEQEYHLELAAEGGIGAYSWALSGDLPPGLRFTERGIHGTVPAGTGGDWRMSAVVSDELGQKSAAAQLSLRVLPSEKPERPLPEPAQAEAKASPAPALPRRPSPHWERAALSYLLAMTALVSLGVGAFIGRRCSRIRMKDRPPRPFGRI